MFNAPIFFFKFTLYTFSVKRNEVKPISTPQPANERLLRYLPFLYVKINI